MGYKRYETLRDGNGGFKQSPFIKIPERNSDKYVEWNTTRSRFDLLSYKYYGSAEYGFLITYANSEYLSEWEINDGTVIRIPYPLQSAIEDYESIINAIVGYN